MVPSPPAHFTPPPPIPQSPALPVTSFLLIHSEFLSPLLCDTHLLYSEAKTYYPLQNKGISGHKPNLFGLNTAAYK